MKRYRYGNNFETVQMGDVHGLLPVGYIEVVPGDTIGGTVSIRVLSDVTKKAMFTRAYMDAYAFHVPFRVLHPDFADWIRTDGAAGSIPTIGTSFRANFEPDAATHPAWFRYTYNDVWNKFFKGTENLLDAPRTANAVQACVKRKSTFAESIILGGLGDMAGTTVPVDTVGGSVAIDDLRAGFAVDRIKKLRGFYGNKYTDFLASLGVEAGWSILDEPEVIAKKGVDLQFRTTKATYQASDTITGGASALGSMGGQWQGGCKLPIKRTFCPEHGLIAVFAVVRLERYNVRHSHALLHKLNPDQYWRPELAYQRLEDVSWLLGTNTLAQQAVVPPFEDLRKGQNLVAGQGAVDAAYLANQHAVLYDDSDESVIDITTPNATDFTGLFAGQLSQQVQLINEFRLVKHSPVKPDVRNVGVQ